MNFLGLDRKKMEEERLARKRKASTSPPHPSKSQKVRTSAPLVPAPKKDKGLEYLQGTVRKTWAFGHDRGLGHEEIRLEEVLRKDDLRLAVLSSFQWDIGWLLSKVNMRNTQVTLVMQAEDEATKQQYAQETADMPNLRLCFPTMEGQINCMHSKLMLLSYANHLRIVVPTANLVPYDWGETGDMENMLFLIDLPRLAEGRRSESLTHFGKELFWFLQAQGLEQSIISSLHNFDFAGTEDLAFVHTIGGAHLEKDGDWARTGYCGLGRAVKKLGLSTGVPLSIDFVASSIGAVNLDFMATLYLAAHGDDGRTEYEWRNPPKGKAKKSKVDGPGTKEQDIKAEIVRNFRIYFPTYETVRKSIAGSAGTICFQSKWYNSATFPRRVMRECKSARSGLLMHNKILYVRPQKSGDSLEAINEKSTSWAYIGSANCSESAWGKLVKDRETKAPKLNCRNWECGVLLPVRSPANEPEQNGMAQDLTTFRGIVPVPMEYPGEAYGDKKPWFYSEQC